MNLRELSSAQKASLSALFLSGSCTVNSFSRAASVTLASAVTSREAVKGRLDDKELPAPVRGEIHVGRGDFEVRQRRCERGRRRRGGRRVGEGDRGAGPKNEGRGSGEPYRFLSHMMSPMMIQSGKPGLGVPAENC